MAKFIKIKKENLASSLNYTVDILIGVDQIALVKKGSNSAINANEATIFFQDASSYVTLTDSTKGADIASAINSALTANPGGVVATVQLASDIEITAIAVA
tara:strand:- start:1831 stop:2133 length:303 start_codon:yes stop_codon:yes gene_type:complete